MATEAQTARVVGALRAAGCVRAPEEAALLVRAAPSPAELAVLVERRVAGEPLEHVLGWARFADEVVAVAPGVFVPRHRSEHLVAVASGWAVPGTDVLDVCAGTGALGLALHRRCGPFRLVATDIDPAAVRCAAQNLAPIGGRALLGDLFDELPLELLGAARVILANAPYVPSHELDLLPREAREHEARAALDGGADGLMVHRRLLGQAPCWLAPGGVVVIEVAAGQVADAVAAVRSAGLRPGTHPAPDDDGTVVVTGGRAD